tara:strand:- start:3532 stop:4992 length:1461 start_codon:yes stop_codon:yes gene_type:complete
MKKFLLPLLFLPFLLTAQVDLKISKLLIPSHDVLGSTQISGEVTNVGSNKISSFEIVWSEGSSNHSEVFHVDLNPLESYTFTHSETIETPTLKTYNIRVSANTNGDVNIFNNSLNHILRSVTFIPKKKVLFEDQTIAANAFGWWSPRGIVRLDEVMNTPSTDSIEYVCVHGNTGTGAFDDAMFHAYYSGMCMGGNDFVNVSGWPGNLVDRKASLNYGTIIGSALSHFTTYKNDYGVADIDVFPLYGIGSNGLPEVTVSTALKFAANESNLNLALVITEDSVHNSTDWRYCQMNAYDGGGNGPLATSGVDFTTVGHPVPPSAMYHRHVARNIIPSFYGDTSALPSSIIAGSTYGHSFDSWTVPTGVDPTRLRAIVLLIDPSNGQVLNTNGADVFSSVDIEEIDNSLNFEVFPNPSTDKVFLKVNIDLADDAKITLTDLNGKIILDQDLNGENGKRTFEINKTNVSKGIYILSLENNDKTSNKKIVFE